MASATNFGHFEYLLFNGLVLLFPLAFSFERRIAFYKNWRLVFPAIFLGSAPFLAWDLWAVGKHWDFNPATHLGLRLAGLPIEEWLFFLCVPYALLFVWENVKLFVPARESQPRRMVPLLAAQWVLLGSAIVFLFFREKAYLGIATAALGVVLLFSTLVFRTAVYYGWRLIAMLALFIILTTLANGYLTARPVVVYEESLLTGLRIFRIPIEDYVFGLAHAALILTTYEYFKKRFSGATPTPGEKENRDLE